MEHKKQVEELRNRIKMISHEKAKASDQTNEEKMDTEPAIKVHVCKDCGFKTNWINNYNTHKKQCKKTKKQK